MRMPIKLNRAGWPRLLSALPLMSDDPRSLALGRSGATRESFSQSVSVLKFGTTFKTTLPGRQPDSNRFLAARYAGKAPVVLDIGASDGSTSLDLLGALTGQFGHYFVTDFNISVRWGVDMRGRYYFTDASGACILSASPRWLIYADVGDAPLALKAARQAPTLRLAGRQLLGGDPPRPPGTGGTGACRPAHHDCPTRCLQPLGRDATRFDKNRESAQPVLLLRSENRQRAAGPMLGAGHRGTAHPRGESSRAGAVLRFHTYHDVDAARA